MTDFDNINPYCAALYFAAVIFFSMIFTHPGYCLIGLIFSCRRAGCIMKKSFWLSLPYTAGAAMALAVINPLFNTRGDTVLFYIFSRRYTLEALAYGCVMGCIFMCGINWFGCMGKILGKDKFSYIFKGKLPNVCLLLAVISGLIPLFGEKLEEIYHIQALMHPKRKKAVNAFSALSAGANYAFELSIALSFSMKNRGFGCTKPTNSQKFAFKGFDVFFAALTLLLTAGVLPGVSGGTNRMFFPSVNFSDIPFGCAICYCILSALPCLLYIYKEIKWLYLKSKI